MLAWAVGVRGLVPGPAGAALMGTETNICVQCGMCCDGTLYSRVCLEPADDADQLRATRLVLVETAGTLSFHQPCPELENSRCGLYHGPARPVVCAKFRCTLLRAVHAGTIDEPRAQAIITDVLALRARVIPFLDSCGVSRDVALFPRLAAVLRLCQQRDAAFRRAHAREILDCVLLRNRLQEQFWRDRPGRASRSDAGAPDLA
jgi:uncharacterized protein